MSIQLQIILILAVLLAGVAAIFMSNRMMRKFKLPYLSSYFYFLIFFYVFGVYSILGSQIFVRIFENHQLPSDAILSAEGILIAIGIPFLVLAWYMFLRMSMELFGEKIPNFLIAVFFSFFAVSFIVYAIMNLNIGGLESFRFFMDSRSLKWTFSALMMAIFFFSLISILVKTKNLNDIHQRKAYRYFVLWYFVIIAMGVLSLQLSPLHEIFGFIFIWVLLGFHIIPILFLNIYLQEHYQGEEALSGIQNKLEEAIKKYEISKRETEVIELICKGMSNKEISDSLFISLQTVKDHIHRIYTKTGVKNRVQLINLVGSS